MKIENLELDNQYNSTLEYLYNRLPVFHNIGGAAYKPGLANTIELLNNLSNPHNKFESIHVAGTNGKGSVSHFLASIFQTAGYKVGLYTSPHLVDFGERIRVNGEMIDKQYVIDFVENNKKVFSSIEPSFFELTMAMAFNYFADCEVDIAIIEVGLGGRLDSTNVIHPLMSIITNISYDHVDFLGNTLEKIASEKAGIIKNNTPVIVGEFLPETLPVFVNKAHEMQAPFVLNTHQFEVIGADEQGKSIFKNNVNQIFTVGLSGNYQTLNVGTVITAIDVFNQEIVHKMSCDNNHLIKSKVDWHSIEQNHLKEGLKNVVEITHLQGRWQLLGQKPQIIVDTAHNVSGIQFIVNQLNTINCKNLHLVIGMVKDKDVDTVLKLLPEKAQYYFTQATVARALPADELAFKARSNNLQGSKYSSVEIALTAAISNAHHEDTIFVGGSNFIVGDAIKFLKTTNY